ncbi:uncharacterized protein LOC130724980 [Lotus japonicus]|uniref:uncharacterized protein LOC130724980 n=1 Tax=Lotus japonicus TaxID=34305 RepID=UPI00258A682B|nr:uncharacterized protein LOC130724980 [Lotus japonicus]
MAIDNLATIDASKENWSIVRKGCKIHSSVRKTLIYRFQSLLSEEHVYQISSFGVGESGRDFRPTSYPFKINFDIHTFVRLVPNKSINLSPYNFVPISDIMFEDLDTSFLIDVIGILTGASGEQEFEKDGTKQKIITIKLEQDGLDIGKQVGNITNTQCTQGARNAQESLAKSEEDFDHSFRMGLDFDEV